MKKILIATTALVATAGVAAAEVNFSGYARYGMQYVEDGTTDVVSRFRLQADVKTTTDAGIGLNARQRFQTEEGNTGNGGNGVRFGVTYEGLAVNFGNINGVIESAPNLYMSTNSAGIGLEGQSWSNLAVNNAGGAFGWTAYSSGGAGANGVEAIYSANGLGLHVHDTDVSTGYGANYKISNITLAAAREDFDNGTEITFASAGVALGNGKVAVSWGDTNGVTKAVVAAGYNMAPGANIHAFIGNEDAGDSYGVGVNYSLGGGASFDAGVDANAAGQTRVSAGLFFSF